MPMLNPPEKNHGDVRTVTTDALETLGMVHFKAEARDAIHLAVLPVEAACTLMPGAHIGLMDDGRAMDHMKKSIGIVDPFLPGPVHAGEKFWLVVYPRMISSLRHVWVHPDVPDNLGG